MKTSNATISKTSSKKVSKTMTALSLVAIMSVTGCSSTQGTSSGVGGRIMQSVILGAATGAVTRVNGNSEDIKDAATVGALLGLLGGFAR